jgi:acyl-CoA reductase-like NAD-dependent aldehyde dehydrogenase
VIAHIHKVGEPVGVARIQTPLEPLQCRLVETGGCYVQPTIFNGVDTSMISAREEIFGSDFLALLAVMSFTDKTAVVRQANVSIYGLQAGIWIGDLKNSAPGSEVEDRFGVLTHVSGLFQSKISFNQDFFRY